MTAIRFLGAAGSVTGSRHLIEHDGKRILLDCGLFQGRKSLRKRNWEGFPVPPSSIDAVVLSHAHIDHTGWLPALCKHGFDGQIYSTAATRDLLTLMLPDSGRLHEEEARYANKRGYSKHSPALPLYTEQDARKVLPRIRRLGYDQPRAITEGAEVTLRRAGHILGSASVQLWLGDRRVIFSGDLGRYDRPIIPDPDPLGRPTTLLLECTYGDRTHDQHHPQSDLRDEVLATIDRRGVLIIPAFAIGRTQELLYHLRQLQQSGELPTIPIYVDSPMACDATPFFLMHPEEQDDEMAAAVSRGAEPLHPERVQFARSPNQSRAINDCSGPMIIISASGMASGGRVLHHLKRRLPDERTTVLFAGYQAVGTRGRRLIEGEPTLRIHGVDVEVRARIGQIYGFSAHADAGETDRWLQTAGQVPDRTFCIHGEADSLQATRARLEARGWPAYVPDYLESVEL